MPICSTRDKADKLVEPNRMGDEPKGSRVDPSIGHPDPPHRPEGGDTFSCFRLFAELKSSLPEPSPPCKVFDHETRFLFGFFARFGGDRLR